MAADDYLQIDWEDQVKNGGGCFSMSEEDFTAEDFHIDLEDKMYGGDHRRNELLRDGRRSLVFTTPLLQEIRSSDSFREVLCVENVTEDGGIKKKVLRKGNGVKPLEGSQVWTHYISFCEGYQDTPFDSTKEHGRMFSFKLDGSKMPYLDLSVRSMEFNEVSVFRVGWEYGFGPLGCLPRVPPKCRLLVIIELVGMEASSKPVVFVQSAEERQKLPFNEILKEAERLKKVGNDKFEAGDYDNALKSYRIAFGVLFDYNTLSTEEIPRKQSLQYHLMSNMAECCLRRKDPESISGLLAEVRRLGIPMLDAKLLVRFAKACVAVTKHQEALDALQEALGLEPGHAEVMILLRKVKRRICIERMESDQLNHQMFKLYMKDIAEAKDNSSSGLKLKSSFSSASPGVKEPTNKVKVSSSTDDDLPPLIRDNAK